MPYDPISYNNLKPGVFANTWGKPALNHNELYEDTVCHLAGSGYFTSMSTTATSYPATPSLSFLLYKNLDNNKLRVKARMNVANAAATGTILVQVDGTDTATATTTSTTAEWVTVDVTLTTSSTNRVVYVFLKTSNASHSVQLYALNAYIVGAAPGSGTLASDFVSFSSTAESPTGAPIATEYVQRVGDGPIRIAKDRFLTLGTVMDNAIAPRADFQSTSASFATAYCGQICVPDTITRNYTVSVFQGPGTVVPETRVTIANQVITLTGPGWVDSTFELAGSSSHGLYEPFRVELRRVSGSSPAGLGTLFFRRAE